MSTRTALRCCIFVFLQHRIDLTYDMSIKSLLQRCVAPTRRAAALCGSIVWQHFYCCFLLLTCHKMRSHKSLPSLFLSSKLLAALPLLLLNMQQKLQLQQRRPQHATTHIILQQFLADADAVPWPEGACPGGAWQALMATACCCRCCFYILLDINFMLCSMCHTLSLSVSLLRCCNTNNLCEFVVACQGVGAGAGAGDEVAAPVRLVRAALRCERQRAKTRLNCRICLVVLSCLRYATLRA